MLAVAGRQISRRAATAVSFRPVLIPATALDPQKGGERIDCGARIGMRVEPASSRGADAAPLPHQQGAAEQIGPNRHAIVSPLVQLRPDAHERGGFREQRQLNRRRRGRGRFAAFGHDVATTVTPAVRPRHRNRSSGGAIRAGCVTSHPVRAAQAKNTAGQGRGGGMHPPEPEPLSLAGSVGWSRTGSRARRVNRRATGVLRGPLPTGAVFARQASLSRIHGRGSAYRAFEVGCLN